MCWNIDCKVAHDFSFYAISNNLLQMNEKKKKRRDAAWH